MRRGGPADKGLRLYAEGLLLRAAGRNEDAAARFREGASDQSPYTRYLNGSAQDDPPLPRTGPFTCPPAQMQRSHWCDPWAGLSLLQRHQEAGNAVNPCPRHLEGCRDYGAGGGI